MFGKCEFIQACPHPTLMAHLVHSQQQGRASPCAANSCMGHPTKATCKQMHGAELSSEYAPALKPTLVVNLMAVPEIQMCFLFQMYLFQM